MGKIFNIDPFFSKFFLNIENNIFLIFFYILILIESCCSIPIDACKSVKLNLKPKLLTSYLQFKPLFPLDLCHGVLLIPQEINTFNFSAIFLLQVVITPPSPVVITLFE